MIKFKTNGKLGKFIITLPTNIKDLSADYLKSITEDISVAPNYALICIAYKDKLSNFIITAKRAKPTQIATVPIYVKGECEDKSIALNAGDKIIISGSDISLGYHVTTPSNDLNLNKFINYIDGDNNAYQRAITEQGDNYVYFIEFKIVPYCNIVGEYKEDIKVNKDNIFAIKADLDITL